MSLIIHRCSTCGHPDIFHNGTQCCAGHCASGVHQPRFGESVLMPTKRSDTKELVEEIAKPGSRFTGMGALPLDLCGCEDCVALYTESVGVAS